MAAEMLLKRRPYNLIVGSLLIGVVVIGALLSFVWLPVDPNAMNFGVQLSAPSGENWLGADHFGRDLFSRVLVGARGTLYVGFIAVGIALVLGVTRIVLGWSLPKMIIGGYAIVLALTLFAPAEIIGIAYDSGAVTTSVITVPLVTALGIGLASSLSDRNPLTDGFGMIAFILIVPMIFVMLYGTFLSWS